MSQRVSLPESPASWQPFDGPRYPSAWDLIACVAILGWLAALGMATVHLNFLRVDWRIECRDLQNELRHLEASNLKLRRDIAQFSEPDRLATLGDERLGLAKVDPQRLERLYVPGLAAAKRP